MRQTGAGFRKPKQERTRPRGPVVVDRVLGLFVNVRLLLRAEADLVAISGDAAEQTCHRAHPENVGLEVRMVGFRRRAALALAALVVAFAITGCVVAEPPVAVRERVVVPWQGPAWVPGHWR